MVAYFDSPTNPDWPSREIENLQLKRATLPEQTRAYFFDPTLGAWRMGRVFDHIGRDIHIQLPNQQKTKVQEDEVQVRWTRPLDDPWKHLVARLSETPLFHHCRHRLVRHLVRQRAASAGLTALLSAPVELHPHQIGVIRRVLTDPVQRYLLADEVGLGKTIEAGIILRQHLLDHPMTARALIIAPEALIPQWQDQLRDRCQIDPDTLAFAPLEEIDGWREFQPNFIIVDEAHQLARMGGGAFAAVRKLADPSRCRNLLLLSATPVLRNESGFLALLHLLDPAVYDLADVAGFRARIAKRQDLADLFASFTEDQLPFFLLSSASDLAASFPEDQRLQAMITGLLPLLEQDDGTAEEEIRIFVRRIRSQLSETYRLHRRILRNRRAEQSPNIMTGRRKLIQVPWASLHWPRIHAALEDWRTAAAASVWGREDSPEAEALVRVFILFWEAAQADLAALVSCARVRTGHGGRPDKSSGPLADENALRQLRAAPLFDGEEDLLRSLTALERIRTEHEEEQILITRQVIWQLLGNGRRIVCLTTSPHSADALHASLSQHSDPVIRHDTASDDWAEQWRASGPSILICDWRAEEGLNLQGGDCCLIHLDLPFSPNRIEQRMGRLDRFGVGKKVTSVALKPDGAITLDAWALCLDRAWQVFSRSIAALQYVVESEMDALCRAFFLEGADAINSCRERLAAPDGLEREFKLIRNQDALDSIQAGAADESGPLRDRIEQYEETDDELAAALDAWMSGCLKFIKVGERELRDTVIRYHHSRAIKGTNTLLSLHDLQFWFAAAIDREARHHAFKPPLTHAFTHHRQTAVRRNCGLARMGNPVIDSILAHLAWDDRGTCFGMWRQVGDLELPAPRMFFRLDFIVEADVTEEDGGPLVRRLADAAFPPIIETIWIDQDLQPADEESLFELERPYRKPHDTNLTPGRWPLALERTGCGPWTDLCDAVRSAGERQLVEMHELRALAEAKADEFTAARALAKDQLTTRLEAMAETQISERAVLEQEIAAARALTRTLAAGVLQPLIRLDSAGVIILSGEPLEQQPA